MSYTNPSPIFEQKHQPRNSVLHFPPHRAEFSWLIRQFRNIYPKENPEFFKRIAELPWEIQDTLGFHIVNDDGSPIKADDDTNSNKKKGEPTA